MSQKKRPLLMEQAAPNNTAQAILDGTWLPRTVFVADDGHFILASDVLLEMVSEAGLIHSPGDVVTRVNELIHGLVEAGCEIRYGVGTAVPPTIAPVVWREQGTFIPMSPEDAATRPWDHYGFIPCSQFSYNDRRGDETLALWVLVGPDQIYPVHPRGPYGVVVETYSGHNWCISLYDVALKLAVRDNVG